MDTTVVAISDVDSDGFPDAVIGTRVESELKWARNDGSGNFSPGLTIRSGVDVLHVEAADLDGDGDQDVIVVSSDQPSQVQVFKNIDGTGYFDPVTVNASVGGPVHRMQLRDMDGDGDRDLVLIQRSPQRLAWFANSGSGSFSSSAQVLFSGADYTAMAWGDVTGDANADVFVAAGNTISWRSCVNASCGTVQTLPVVQTAIVDLFLADADGDGDRDLFSANTGQVSLLLNTAGAFGTRAQIVPDGASDGSRTTLVLDADGDARAEVFTVNGSALRQWSRRGTDYAMVHSQTLPAGSPAHLRSAQIIPGGRSELLLLNRYRGEVSWIGEPQSAFALSNLANTFHHSLRNAAPYVFDMDVDGDLDHVYGTLDG
ncbi:MAG TPA: VCBS repeat-containing protein, partial [Flavobacteriales bacterium]|nr:VCBS repeat-containing protein [Flavobacteriales bacterium]